MAANSQSRGRLAKSRSLFCVLLRSAIKIGNKRIVQAQYFAGVPAPAGIEIISEKAIIKIGVAQHRSAGVILYRAGSKCMAYCRPMPPAAAGGVAGLWPSTAVAGVAT